LGLGLGLPFPPFKISTSSPVAVGSGAVKRAFASDATLLRRPKAWPVGRLLKKLAGTEPSPSADVMEGRYCERDMRPAGFLAMSERAL
jgi:hypothetical protein